MQTHKKISLVLASVFVLSSSPWVLAEQPLIATGRYLTAFTKPAADEENPLAQIIEVRFPSTVVTIGDAMHYLLRFSGYQLVAEAALTLDVQNLLHLPLPNTNRKLGPLSLQEGLLTLAGKPFGLLIDPVHRLLAFRLLPDYGSLYLRSSV